MAVSLATLVRASMSLRVLLSFSTCSMMINSKHLCHNRRSSTAEKILFSSSTLTYMCTCTHVHIYYSPPCRTPLACPIYFLYIAFPCTLIHSICLVKYLIFPSPLPRHSLPSLPSLPRSSSSLPSPPSSLPPFLPPSPPPPPPLTLFAWKGLATPPGGSSCWGCRGAGRGQTRWPGYWASCS